MLCSFAVSIAAQDLELSFMSPSEGFRLTGAAATDESGYAVNKLGDVNDDEIKDFIIGAYHADPLSGANAGISYVIFGRDVIGGATPFSDITLTTGATALSSTIGFRVLGAGANDESGYAVGSAGDVHILHCNWQH